MTEKTTVEPQLFVFTGSRGVGKSLAAGLYPNIEQLPRTFYHDSERSGNNAVARLRELGHEYGHYSHLGDRFQDLPDDDDLLHRISEENLPWVNAKGRDSLIDYWKYILQDLDANLKHRQFDIYIHDTIEKMESGMAAWVEMNKRKAGVTNEAYGKLWTMGVFPLYQSFFESIFARGVNTIILTSHLKTPWKDGRPVPGKVAPSGKKLLYFLSKLFVWLVPEPSNTSGAPAGLIVKERFASLTPENGRIKAQRMLPRRIPEFDWQNFNNYLTNGANLGNPKPGEVPSEDEIELISELTSNRQMELMLKQMQIELVKKQIEASEWMEDARSDQPEIDNTALIQARQMREAGQSLAEIQKATGLTRPQILTA